jgi:flagellar hook-length control protein FliK
LRSAAQSGVETLEGQTNFPPSAGATPTAARPTAEVSAQPRGTLAPESEAHIAGETKRSADAKQAAGLGDTPVAVTSENAPDPAGATVSGVVGSAAAGAAPGAARDFPPATPGKDDEVAIAPNLRPEIASAIVASNLTQLATRQNPEPTRSRNSSTNAPERNGSQPVAPAEANDRTQPVSSAQPATTAKPSFNSPSTEIAPARSDRTATSPADHPAKNDAVSSAPDDASRNTAPLPHAVSAEPAVPSNPGQAGSQFPALLDRVATGMTPTQTLNAMPHDAGAPVKLSFPTAASAPDMPAAMDALAVRIAVHSAGGDKNFSIRLDPPELGHVEVNLNVNAQGHAQAELRADRPQTLELLQKDASALERALRDAGLSMGGGLTFSLKGDGKSGAWRDSQSAARGRNLQIAPVDAARANAAMAGSAALAAQAYGFSTRRLDIRV